MIRKSLLLNLTSKLQRATNRAEGVTNLGPKHTHDGNDDQEYQNEDDRVFD